MDTYPETATTVLPSKNKTLKHLPWLTLLTGAAALLIHFLPTGVNNAIQLDRESLSLTNTWTLLTSHLTHWNFSHLIWDLLMFLILGTLVEQISRKAWFATLAFSSLAISLSFLLFRPDLQFYRGLSGIDMALASVYVLHQLLFALQRKDIANLIIFSISLVAIFAKPTVEISLKKSLFISDLGSGIQNLPLAHLIGSLIGIEITLTLSTQPRSPTQ